MSFYKYLKYFMVSSTYENKCGKCNRTAKYYDCFFPYEVTGNRCSRCYESDQLQQGGE